VLHNAQNFFAGVWDRALVYPRLGSVAPGLIRAVRSSEVRKNVAADAFDADSRTKDVVDQLGHKEIGERLAIAITDRATEAGIVVGVEGDWGAGKSTLIRWTSAALAALESAAPVIVKFEPWLINARDAMLHDLFADLARAASTIEPDAAYPLVIRIPLLGWTFSLAKWPFINRAWARRTLYKRRVRSAFSAFAALAGSLRRAAKAASIAGVPYAELTHSALDRAERAMKHLIKEPALESQKQEITSLLSHLSRRIVVWIDDLDRLEPEEASEMLRLVRAVADFPNVIYVLCYERQVLAHSLEQALRVRDGDAYLQKFVQVSFRIPAPKPFALRRWFRAELANVVGDNIDVVNRDDEAGQRLATVVDVFGSLLETPRDVVRVLNGIRLYFPPVRGEVDVPDLVWVQLLRIKNPKLYKWVELYIRDQAATMTSRNITIASRAIRDRMVELQEVLSGEDFSMQMHRLANLLPGLSHTFGRDQEFDGWQIHAPVEDDIKTSLVASKRLANPFRHRFYFALASDENVSFEARVRAFIDLAAAAKWADGEAKFKELTGGGPEADVVVDLLRGWSTADQIPNSAIPVILWCLASQLDSAARAIGKQDWGRYFIWSDARSLLRSLLPKLGPERIDIVTKMFEKGAAIGWLTEIMRGETFAHGRVGDRSEKDPSEWLLTDEELDKATQALLSRYRISSPTALLRTPDFISLLHGWAQASSYEEVTAWVAQVIQGNVGLLNFLEAARSWVSGSDGVRYEIQQHNAGHFLQLADAKKRVETISTDGAISAELRAKAKQLLSAFERGIAAS
jgi:predicted KAP-like P-loop ATPase